MNLISVTSIANGWRVTVAEVLTRFENANVQPKLTLDGVAYFAVSDFDNLPR